MTPDGRVLLVPPAAAGFDDAFLDEELAKHLGGPRLDIIIRVTIDHAKALAVWLANPLQIPY